MHCPENLGSLNRKQLCATLPAQNIGRNQLIRAARNVRVPLLSLLRIGQQDQNRLHLARVLTRHLIS